MRATAARKSGGRPAGRPPVAAKDQVPHALLRQVLLSSAQAHEYCVDALDLDHAVCPRSW